MRCWVNFYFLLSETQICKFVASNFSVWKIAIIIWSRDRVFPFNDSSLECQLVHAFVLFKNQNIY